MGTQLIKHFENIISFCFFFFLVSLELQVRTGVLLFLLTSVIFSGFHYLFNVPIEVKSVVKNFLLGDSAWSHHLLGVGIWESEFPSLRLPNLPGPNQNHLAGSLTW